jgi:carbamoyl-phosphate synthase large subunit
MNILITSAGTRGYLIRYFKKILRENGKIFAADCSKYAPALYNADNYFIVPAASDENYISELYKICLKNDVKGIISLNDVELPLLAQHKSKFMEKGIKLVVSDPETIDVCYDKYKTFKFLKENKFTFAKTYISIDDTLRDIKSKNLKFPLLLKPRKGSSSRGIKKVFNIAELRDKFEEKKFIIQELLQGDEYGVDVFCNSDLVPISIFAKRKIRIVAGVADKEVTVYDDRMIDYIKKIIGKLKVYGPGDLDLIKRGNEYFILDINPRFGGGYPIAHAVGADFPKKIIRLINGDLLEADFRRYPDNIVMMKQYEIVIKNFNILSKKRS